MSSSVNSNTDLRLEALADEFLEELRAGKNPVVREYAQRIPERFDEIADYLDLICLTEGRGKAKAWKKPRIPAAIGELQIESLLGRGGMGIVYLARHPRISRKVAVKVLTEKRASRPGIRERFLVEAEAIARLDHPNIVSLHDFGDDSGQSFLVMQYIDGQALSDFLPTMPESPEDSSVVRTRLESKIQATGASNDRHGFFQFISRLGSDVASALMHAHENNTVHRDIKPSNLLLDNDGKVWITDFGLAKIRDIDTDLSNTGDMIGTPTYMAPEQVRGIVDPRSDIYSLGVTLWELCTGRRAWEAVDKQHVLDFKLNGVRLMEVQKVNPNVPDDLANIIMTACAYDPDERYQTAKELKYVLNRFAHGEAVSDRRKRPRDAQPRPWLRRHFIAAGFVVAMLAGALIVSVTQPDANSNVPEIAVAGTETAPGEYSIAENESSIAIVADELRSGTLAGDDGSLFELSPQTGELRFLDEPDFEAPSDRKGDNTYELTITPETDDVAELPLIIRVSDVDEPLVLSNIDPQQVHLRMRKGDWSVPFDQLGISDPESAGYSLTVTGGRDAGLFRVIAGNELVALPELPPRQEPYEVIVEVCDKPAFERLILTQSDEKWRCRFWTRNKQGASWDPLVSRFLHHVDSCGMTWTNDGNLLVAIPLSSNLWLYKGPVTGDLTAMSFKVAGAHGGMPFRLEAFATRHHNEFYIFGRKLFEGVASPNVERYYWRATLVEPYYSVHGALAEPKTLNFHCDELRAADFVGEDTVELVGIRDGQTIRSILNLQTGQTTTPRPIHVPSSVAAMATSFPEVTGGNRTPLRLLVRVSSVSATSQDAGEPKQIWINNETGKVLQLYWLNAGVRQPYGMILAPGARNQDTFVGHVWQVDTEDGVHWDSFEVRADSDQVIIRERFRNLDTFVEEPGGE